MYSPTFKNELGQWPTSPPISRSLDSTNNLTSVMLSECRARPSRHGVEASQESVPGHAAPGSSRDALWLGPKTRRDVLAALKPCRGSS